MASQYVQDRIAAGFSLEDLRQEAVSEYQRYTAAGFTRKEIDDEIFNKYAMRFDYDPETPDNARLIEDWMTINPQQSTEADIDFDVETFTNSTSQAGDSSRRINENSSSNTNANKPLSDLTRLDSEPKKVNSALANDTTEIRQATDEERWAKPIWNPVREASGLLDSVMSGWQGSATGLWYRGGLPNISMGRDSSIPEKIAHSGGAMLGDLPTFVAGGIAGGAATIETGPGALVGAMAGGMGLTEAVKASLMDQYQNGRFKDFSDYLTRTAKVTWAGVKGAVTGAAGGLAGARIGVAATEGLMARGMSEYSSSLIGQSIARPLGEVGTFATVGAALNGQVPTAEDFIVGASTLGLAKFGGFYTSKLRNIYVNTNTTPKSIVQWVSGDKSAREDLSSVNINTPRSMGGDYRPVYAISRDALPENLTDYKGQVGWMRLSKNESELVVNKANKKNGFADDGTYIKDVPEGTAAPTPLQAVPYAIRNDAPMLWFKTPNDPNIGRLFKQFADASKELPTSGVIKPSQVAKTKKDWLAGINANDEVALIKRGRDLLLRGDEDFLAFLQSGRGKTGVAQESVIPSDVQGIRFGDRVLIFDNTNIIPRAMADSPEVSLAYSADAIASSLSVGETARQSAGDKLNAAYEQLNDKFQPLNSPAPIGQVTPSYLMARMFPGTDGLFLHWMDFGTTMFGKVKADGSTGLPTRAVSGGSYKSMLAEGVRAGNALRQEVLGNAPLEESLGFFRTAFKEHDVMTFSEAKNDLIARHQAGEISDKVYKSAMKRISKDFANETSLSRYGENDPLFYLRTYLTAKHNISLAERGIQGGPDLAASRAIAENPLFVKHLEPAAQQFYEFGRAVQEYRRDAGLISQKQMENERLENPVYAPFARDMGDTGPRTSTGTYKLKGSTRRIIDPLESMIRQTQFTLKAAEKNQVARLAAEQFGTELKTAQDPNAGPAVATMAKAEEVISRGSQARGATISWRDNGVVKTAVVPNEIARVINTNLDPQSSNILVNLAGAMTSVNRAGIILHPAFAIRNLTRDQISAAINSTSDYTPWFSFLEGLGTIAVKGKEGKLSKLFPNAKEQYAEWMRHGGAVSNMVSQNREYAQETISRLLQENNVVNSVPLTVKAVNVLSKYFNPLNIGKAGYKGLQRLAEVSEEGSRMGEYVAARKAGIRPLEAAFKSREVTIDFARSGASIKGLNAISLFLNARIQGADRGVRQAIAHPGQTAEKVLAYVAVPTIMFAMARNDYLYNAPDSDVAKALKEIPNWQKATSWIIPSEAGIFRLAKAQEFGIPFANVIESYIDHLYMRARDKGEDTNFLTKLYDEEYFGTVADQFFLTPSSWQTAFTPSALGHLSAVMYNMDPFTRTPIIPANQEKWNSDVRQSRHTTQVSKKLSDLLNIIDPLTQGPVGQRFTSPQSIDYLVKAYGGTIGKEIWDTVDTLAQAGGFVDKKIKPATALEDMWFVRSFMIRYPAANAKSITEFYDKSERMEMNLNSISALMRRGQATDIQKAQKLMVESNWGRLRAQREILGRLNKSIQFIYEDKTMSPENKREKIDAMYLHMIQIASQGNEIIKMMDKAAKERRQQAREQEVQ